MSASHRERTPAEHDKRADRYRRYTGFAALGMAPLAAAVTLLNKLSQLPPALQWLLVGLAFASTLYVIGLVAFPWSRPLWLTFNSYNPAHWWGFLLPASNTLYIALMATAGFALVSAFLYLQGLATTSPERALSDHPFNASFEYYAWSFLNAIPVLELPNTLGWELSFRYTDQVSRLLLLLYKILVIGPMIATGILVWRDVQRLHSEKRGGLEANGL